ncbi:MAG: hypothetical protein Q9163_004899 [Psora crenata]
MAAALNWLTTLKSAQLKSLSAAIGINSSGTKPTLITQLRNHLRKAAFAASNGARGKDGSTSEEEDGQNVISIDMGIRNLAYCRFHIPKVVTRTIQPVKPSILEWNRVNVSLPTAFSTANGSDKPQPPDKAEESFDPPTYAAHAYTLLQSLLRSSPHTAKPTHILIERQRYRSMSGSGVQEWTLRVNMFEAMLYAVLETLRREGKWEGNVVGINPGRVQRFWLGEGGLASESPPKRITKVKRSVRNKMLKIQLVGKWLEAMDMFDLDGEAKTMGERYVKKTEEREGQGKLGKLDDLADCLLQGMAWLRWEENRRLIRQRGADVLKELESR